MPRVSTIDPNPRGDIVGSRILELMLIESEVLPRLAREHDVSLHEVTPTDESLESVFAYLVSS